MHVRGPRCTSCSIDGTCSVRQYKRAQAELCKLGVCLLGSLKKDCTKVFTNPSRSLLSGRTHNHGQNNEQPSHCHETNKNRNSTAKGRNTFLNGVPSFVPVSASTTKLYLTYCRGKSDRRRPMTVRPLPVRRGMPSTRIYSAYCCFRRAAQPSSSYGDSRAPHSRMVQGVDSRRGQRWVRSSKGVRAQQFARSIQKCKTHECVQTRTRTSICTPWIAVNIALTRSTHQRVPQIVSMKICYCKLYRPNKAIRQAHLEKGDFELADSQRMMAAIYAANLARSRSASFMGIAGRGAAMQETTRGRNDIKCDFCGRVGHFKIKCFLCVKQQQQENDGQQRQQREGQQNHLRRQHQRDRRGGRGPVWCSYHKTTPIATPTAAPGGANRLTATLTLLQPGLRG